MAGKRDYEEILSDDAEDGGRLNASMRRQVETMKMLPSECLNQNPRVNVKEAKRNYGKRRLSHAERALGTYELADARGMTGFVALLDWEIVREKESLVLARQELIVPLCWCSEDWRRVAIPIAAYTKPGIMKWKEEDFLKHPAIPNPETFYELDIHFFVNGVICENVKAAREFMKLTRDGRDLSKKRKMSVEDRTKFRYTCFDPNFIVRDMKIPDEYLTGDETNYKTAEEVGDAGDDAVLSEIDEEENYSSADSCAELNRLSAKDPSKNLSRHKRRKIGVKKKAHNGGKQAGIRSKAPEPNNVQFQQSADLGSQGNNQHGNEYQHEDDLETSQQLFGEENSQQSQTQMKAGNGSEVAMEKNAIPAPYHEVDLSRIQKLLEATLARLDTTNNRLDTTNNYLESLTTRVAALEASGSMNTGGGDSQSSAAASSFVEEWKPRLDAMYNVICPEWVENTDPTDGSIRFSKKIAGFNLPLTIEGIMEIEDLFRVNDKTRLSTLGNHFRNKLGATTKDGAKVALNALFDEKTIPADIVISNSGKVYHTRTQLSNLHGVIYVFNLAVKNITDAVPSLKDTSRKTPWWFAKFGQWRDHAIREGRGVARDRLQIYRAARFDEPRPSHLPAIINADLPDVPSSQSNTNSPASTVSSPAGASGERGDFIDSSQDLTPNSRQMMTSDDRRRSGPNASHHVISASGFVPQAMPFTYGQGADVSLAHGGQQIFVAPDGRTFHMVEQLPADATSSSITTRVIPHGDLS